MSTFVFESASQQPRQAQVMSNLAIPVACLVQHAVAMPLLMPRTRLSPRADDGAATDPAPSSQDGALPRFADLGVIISAGVLGCLILGFAAVSYFRRRKETTVAAPAPEVFKMEGGLAPCAAVPRQRTQSKLFDELIRAAYAAHEASCAPPAGADPATRRKSVASGVIYNGVPSVDGTSQKRKSLAVPNF